MHMPLKTRLLKKKDIPQCVEMAKLNFGGDEKALKEDLEAMFNTETWIQPAFHVIVQEDEIIAMAGYAPDIIDFDCFGIFWVQVKEAYKGQGYGKMIMKHLLKAIKKSRKKKDTLLMLACDDEMIKFYKKFGFRKMLTKKDGTLIMARNL